MCKGRFCDNTKILRSGWCRSCYEKKYGTISICEKCGLPGHIKGKSVTGKDWCMSCYQNGRALSMMVAGENIMVYGEVESQRVKMNKEKLINAAFDDVLARLPQLMKGKKKNEIQT